LFLDEVGELPLEIQSAFLRVLQERRFRSVGGRTEDQSDFRLVAATNRDLWGMVQEGAFRHDLLYRLQSFVIDLPRLRDCPSDIQPIAAYHADRFCRRDGLSAKNFSQDFIDALAAYPWPGNVRELVNTIERSLAAAHQEPTLYRKHLPAHLRIHLARASVRSKDDDGRRAAAEPAEPPRPAPARRLTLQEARAQAEKKYLRDLIAETGGDIQAACRVAGLSRSRLYDLLNKYDIRRRPPAGRA
jgi:two-component system NtrC family response regulator